MSEPDKYYIEARALVTHCRYCDRDYKCPEDVEQDRQEVAARLRADGAEIEQLKQAVKETAMWIDAVVEKQNELSQLRAQLESLHGKIMALKDQAPCPYSEPINRASYFDIYGAAINAAAELCAGTNGSR